MPPMPVSGFDPKSAMARVNAARAAQSSQQSSPTGQAQFGQRAQSPTALAGAERPNAFKAPQGQDSFNAGRAAVAPPSFAGATGVSGPSASSGLQTSSALTGATGVKTPNLESNGVAMGGGYANAGFGQGAALAGTRLNRLG